MKPFAALLLLSAAGLSAQEHPDGNRVGIGLYALKPLDTWESSFDPGFQASLQIHFNRESRHLGRLRIDYLRADSKHPVQTGEVPVWNGSTYVWAPLMSNSRMEAYSVVYEWMPHLAAHSHSGLFGIFGMGGTLWNETMRDLAPFTGSDTETELGFTLSVGLGWRFNPHVALEARAVQSELSFHGHRYGSNLPYLAFGASVRF